MIAHELMVHVAIPFKWKDFLFHRGCSFDLKSILDAGLFAGGKESKEGRQTVIFTPLDPGEMRLEKNSKVTYQKAEKSTLQD